MCDVCGQIEGEDVICEDVENALWEPIVEQIREWENPGTVHSNAVMYGWVGFAIFMLIAIWISAGQG